MPDLMDAIQDAQAEASEALQARARIPDAEPPTWRACDDCGDEIPAERLAVMPSAECCVGCAEDRARAARHYARRA